MFADFVVDGHRVVLAMDPALVALRFVEDASQAEQRALAEAFGLGSYEDRFPIPHERYTIFALVGKPFHTPEAWSVTAAALRESPVVARVAPVYGLGRNRTLATDRIIMGVPGEWAPVIDILEEFAWRRLDGWLDQHLVQLREHDDPFETANFLAGLGIFSFVEPDWVTLFDPFPYPGPAGVLVPGAGPGDPYLPKQSALHLTKAIKVHDNGFFGDPKVRIAILDVGIDQSHEDLKHVVVESYDVITGTGSPIPLDDQPHGTGCAGLAAAEANQVGIRGVAAGCSLLAVRISETVTNHPDHVIANSRIAQGIKWAIEHQAAVISLSWYTFPDSTCVTTMVRFALDEGRAKKGCVVVCAAGNRYPGTSGNEVDFPASIDGVIAVGACTNEQNPGPKLLGFGEAWETAAGDKVWVVAPGVNNLTTDLVGSKGADLGDYFSFSGTSSATPLVAGAAALLLSRNPNLTVARIREIFRETAVQVPCKGIYDPQTGHHRQMGFGMLDVLAAVNKA